MINKSVAELIESEGLLLQEIHIRDRSLCIYKGGRSDLAWAMKFFFGHEDGLPNFSFPIGWAMKYLEGSHKEIYVEYI